MRSPTIAQVTDALVTLIAEGSSFGIIGAGMVIAWRLTSKSTRDAIDVYQAAAERAAKTLATERDAWAEREQRLLERITELEERNRPPN